MLLITLLVVLAVSYVYCRKPENSARFVELCQNEPLVQPKQVITIEAPPQVQVDEPTAVEPTPQEVTPELIVVFSDGKTGHSVTFRERPLGFRMYHERYPVEVSSVVSREALAKGVTVGMSVIKVASTYTANMPFQQIHDLLLRESVKLPLRAEQELPQELNIVFLDGTREHPVTFYNRPLGFKLDQEKFPVEVSTVVDQVCTSKGLTPRMRVIKVGEKSTEKMNFQEILDLLSSESLRLPLNSNVV